MTTVKYSVSAYTADGTTTDFLITWDYLDDDHITVEVDGVSNADPTASHTFTKLNDTTVRVTDGIGGAIASGSLIEIRRNTPITTRPISFADGSALLAADLNKNSDYLLFAMQESLDTVDTAAQNGAQAAQAATEAFRDETEGFRDEAEGFRDNTQTYLATVQADATDADNHRIAAAASEAAAAASETAAATSETNAATSETNAATSEANAAASAASILGAVTSSAASATAAATSETNAATSETNAAASAATAGTQASSATASATAAATSETNAATSETNAASSATTASTAATTATTQASASATSAANASTSETNAATSETNAATSEANAATSAANAAVSETNAATSASSASASQVAAAASAASAAASYDSFDDRYLGPKSADPTVDNDGSALVAGALYFNSTANEMRVYDGANWIAASSAGGASLLNYNYTATAGQTTFSGADDNAATLSYTQQNLIVTLNGIVLEDGTDYTASNGTSIVLSTGASAGDELNIVAFKSFTTADMVPASTGGTFSGNVAITGSFTSRGIDDNATSTAMTLDGSGNLLVGKTSPDSTTVGVEARGSGILTATRDSGTPVFFGRNTTDGSILTFQKGSTTVGSIGASGNEIFIGSPNSGGTYLRLGGGGFYPATSTGANSDNTTNIGDPAVRFKDLYLSGGVYLGGTGSANKLDDYEEGTWTPTLNMGAGTLTYFMQLGWYRKVGSLVFIAVDVKATCNAQAFLQDLANLPFTVGSTSGFYPGPAISNAYNVNLGTNGTALGGYWVNGDSRLRFHSYGNNTNQLTPLVSSGVGFEIRIQGFYST